VFGGAWSFDVRPADNLARLLLSSPVLVDRTFRFPFAVDIRASVAGVVSTFKMASGAGTPCAASPSGELASVASSSLDDAGTGVLEDEGALDEFKFSLVRLWLDQRPSMDLFNVFEPYLVTRN
jgi:hypothetical protein